jgi:hypothetical protein
MTTESEWNPIETLTKEDGEVLLIWDYGDKIDIRIGSLFLGRDIVSEVIVSCKLSMGDAHTTMYTARGNEPTGWRKM